MAPITLTEFEQRMGAAAADTSSDCSSSSSSNATQLWSTLPLLTEVRPQPRFVPAYRWTDAPAVPSTKVPVLECLPLMATRDVQTEDGDGLPYGSFAQRVLFPMAAAASCLCHPGPIASVLTRMASRLAR